MSPSAAGDIWSNMPVEVASFIGRRHELSKAHKLLAEHRILTLIGTGGVGKTRLALRVSWQMRRMFPHGVCWVDLAPLADPDLLAVAVTNALGILEQSSRPSVEILSEYLAGRRALLVLDNCEHLLHACAELVTTLAEAARNLRILATSRQPLRVHGECLLEVPPLPVPKTLREAQASVGGYGAPTLFEERAKAVVPGFAVTEANLDAVIRLCQRLDGIPLAIELAAVRLRVLSIEQIIARLDDRFRLLTGGSRTAPVRQQTLLATIEWTASLCSEEERALWARLSVFAGGFDLDAAEYVCSGGGIADHDVLELLANLMDKSVLAREESAPRLRYRLLETVREYGCDLLKRRREESAVRLRHRDWYVGLARRLGAEWARPTGQPGVDRLLLGLIADRANLRVALDHLQSTPGQQQTTFDVLADLCSFWFASGSLREGRHRLDRALADDQLPGRQRATALWASGFCAIHQGDLEPGSRMLVESRAMADEVGDATAGALAATFLGQARMFDKDPRGAVEILDEALAIHRAVGDARGVWVCLCLLAEATSNLGDPQSAELGTQALALAEDSGWDWGKSFSLWVLGLETHRQGKPKRATTLLRDSLRIKQHFDDRPGIAMCLELLARTAGAEGRHERAARLLGAVTALNDPIGIPGARLERSQVSDDPCVTEARQALGDAGFDQAYRKGEALSYEQVIIYALGDDLDRPARPSAKVPAAGTKTLTRRESEIAGLVVQGLTNKEIATRLVISSRTVESHVDHILTKLGFTSRTQIAVWAAETNRPDR